MRGITFRSLTILETFRKANRILNPEELKNHTFTEKEYWDAVDAAKVELGLS